MNNMMRRLVAILVVSVVAMVILSNKAKAEVWATPYGLVSNVCVAPDGSYMVFANQYGLLHTACRFKYFNSPYVYYGTWE